jgi:phospholipid N-methyltransferase
VGLRTALDVARPETDQPEPKMSTFTYLKSFIKDKDVASITPTSKFCIRRVCKPIDFRKDCTILEYGAGTGIFSFYLLKHMTENSSLILFETNNDLFEKLNEINDLRVKRYKENVKRIRKVLGDEMVGKVDYIISGIPFSFLEDSEKMNILNESREMLKKGGRFLAYQTSGHLKQPLREVFGNVSTEFELFNIPPMTVYDAVKE